MARRMEKAFESVQDAYNAILEALVTYFTKIEEAGNGRVRALQNFKEKYDLLKAECDKAEQLVNYEKDCLNMQCIVRKVLGSPPPHGGGEVAVPIAAPTLDLLSHVVREMTEELQEQRNPGADHAP